MSFRNVNIIVTDVINRKRIGFNACLFHHKIHNPNDSNTNINYRVRIHPLRKARNTRWKKNQTIEKMETLRTDFFFCPQSILLQRVEKKFKIKSSGAKILA